MKNPGLGISFSSSVILLLALDAYIILCPMGAAAWWVWLLFMLPSVLYIAAIARVFVFKNFKQSAFNHALWLTLTVFFPILIFTIVSAIGALLGLISGTFFTVFNIIGAVLAAMWLLMSLYGICFGWKRVETDDIVLSFPNLPATFDGYTMVQLSDFHIGTYLASPSTVSAIVDKVNSLNPDLIVFTGDLVNGSASEIEPFMHDLKRLKARDGVLSVLGNHDYCLYRRYTAPNSAEKEKSRVMELEEEAGWKLLRNQSVRIDRGSESIAVVGVENAGGKNFPDFSDLPKALESVPCGQFKILLSHDPSHWRREVVPDTDIELTLAGHTHGMQFKIGRFTPSRLGYREWGGVYQIGPHTLVVSTGIGGNVAFRFGIYPQILQITLRRSHGC